MLDRICPLCAAAYAVSYNFCPIDGVALTVAAPISRSPLAALVAEAELPADELGLDAAWDDDAPAAPRTAVNRHPLARGAEALPPAPPPDPDDEPDLPPPVEAPPAPRVVIPIPQPSRVPTPARRVARAVEDDLPATRAEPLVVASPPPDDTPATRAEPLVAAAAEAAPATEAAQRPQPSAPPPKAAGFSDTAWFSRPIADADVDESGRVKVDSDRYKRKGS